MERVIWAARSRRPHHIANRTPTRIEDAVVQARLDLQKGALGFVGAEAIRAHLAEHGGQELPSARTIARIVQRRGLVDGYRRIRREAPARGWYLPGAAEGRSDIDHFDVIEDLRLEGGSLLSVLTGCSLWGPHLLADIAEQVSARSVLDCCLNHWKRVGCPTYAQFDNDTRFQGGHAGTDVFGRVIRCCLALGITPVFAPPAEQGFQNLVESFNGLWQRKVWERFHHESLAALRGCSDRFLQRYTAVRAARQEHAPLRTPLNPNVQLNLQTPLRGQVIYLRRTDQTGSIKVLGHRWPIDRHWLHRLVRVHVDLTAGTIRFHRLRRHQPHDQSLLLQLPYTPPTRSFHEQ
jgi:hypothetical protein